MHTQSTAQSNVRIRALAKALSIAACAGLLSSAPVAKAAPPDGYIPYLSITATIDGSDWFELTGNQWRWQHRLWDPPEYQEDGIYPTIVNGESFLSTWPSGYVGYSAYNTSTVLAPSQDVLGLNLPLYLEVSQGRDFVSLAQSPNLSNDYTLRILFDDDVSPGYAQYSVTVWAAPVPESETWAMLLAGLGVIGAIGRRRRAFPPSRHD